MLLFIKPFGRDMELDLTRLNGSILTLRWSDRPDLDVVCFWCILRLILPWLIWIHYNFIPEIHQIRTVFITFYCDLLSY